MFPSAEILAGGDINNGGLPVVHVKVKHGNQDITAIASILMQFYLGLTKKHGKLKLE